MNFSWEEMKIRYNNNNIGLCAKWIEILNKISIYLERERYSYLWPLSWTLIALQIKDSTCNAGDPGSWVRRISWRRDRLPTPVFLGFPGGSDGKESTCNVGDLGSIPGLGRPPGGGHGNPLLYFCLENPHGQRSLVGPSPWGCKELDIT